MQKFSRRNFLTLQWRTPGSRWRRAGSPTSGPTAFVAQTHTTDGTDPVTLCGVTLRADLCLAWGGTNCVQCYIACPLQGIALDLDDGRPILNPVRCDGCALCVTACRTVNDLEAMRLTRNAARLESCASPLSRA